MIKAILFDIDDTLVDHATAMRAATIQLYNSLAPDVGFEEFQSKWKAGHAQHYARFLRGEGSYAETVTARIRQAIDPPTTEEQAANIFAKYLADYERGWSLLACVL